MKTGYSISEWILVGIFLAPILVLMLAPPVLIATIILQRTWGFFRTFVFIPRKKSISEKRTEIRDEDNRIYGYHGLTQAYSARDLFPSLRKTDFNKINRVSAEVFELKSGLKSTADALGTYKELHRIFLTMLYRREVLRRAKKWSDEKEKLWLSICPKQFSHGINPYYFDYLKLHEEIREWDEKPVRATA